MAIFGNKKDKSSNSSMATQGNRQNQAQFNIVGEGTVFEGTLRAESNVNVSGRVVGKLIVNGRAVISKSGRVEGELRATNAAVGGTVEGEIFVEERLELESTAHVDGSIQTDRLVVEEGAIFTGSCKMGDAIETDDIMPPAEGASGTTSSGTSSGSSSGDRSSGDRSSGDRSSGTSSGSASSGSSSKGASKSASGSKSTSDKPAAAGTSS
jgi:cytoskeletal protein CcmA (bactofilin family)